MQRTQIYLTDAESEALKAIGRRLGKSQSELIRAAVDRLVEEYSPDTRIELLRAGCGIWKDRTDLPDFSAVRREFDRIETPAE